MDRSESQIGELEEVLKILREIRRCLSEAKVPESKIDQILGLVMDAVDLGYCAGAKIEK